MDDQRTMAQLASEALMAQGACNLSGLVLSWGRNIQRLRTLLHNAGTNSINQHPINQLWASKVHDLTGMGLSEPGTYSTAYTECQRLAGE